MKAFLAKLIIIVTIIFSGLSCKKEEVEVCTACLAYEKDLPPVANAGADISIKYDEKTCSYEELILDGSLSSDPDGKISRYKWQVITPFNEDIFGTEAKTTFNHRGMGEYLVQLQVTDNLGKNDLDTVKVTVVNDFSKTFPNQPINFSIITEIPTFYYGLTFMGGSESKMVFTTTKNDNILILNVQSLSWKEIILSQPRYEFSTLIAGEKIFFVGGGYRAENSWNYSSEKTVDIYDMASGKLSTSNLNEARTGSGAEYFGTKVYFIGGTQFGANDYEKILNNIEIYDTLTKNWTVIPISPNCINCSKNFVRVDNKLYFLDPKASSSNRAIYIFDLETNTWSGNEIKIPPFRIDGGVEVTNSIYWIGRPSNTSSNSDDYQSLIMYNTQNQTSTYTCLPEPIGSYSIFSKNNIVFIINPYTGTNGDLSNFGFLYKPATGQWYNGKSNATFSTISNGIFQSGKEIFAISNNKIYRVDF
jgi:hypothetical protein